MCCTHNEATYLRVDRGVEACKSESDSDLLAISMLCHNINCMQLIGL